ncbi:MAG: choline-sulfatase [Gemmataceae bacterium]|nr:choline-sulfatase [Gemmataceae bacterium]
MRQNRILFTLLLLLAWPGFTFAFEPAKPNVLFIAVDDLNDWVGCLGAQGGHGQVKTPHIDALAKRGLLFSNAHCQSPLCNPSRTSLLFGRHPSSTGVYGLTPGPRSAPSLEKATSLTQAFLKDGYQTMVCGKIYHDGSILQKDRLKECAIWGPAVGMPRPAKPFTATPGKHPAMDWGPFPEDDSAQADWKTASWACERLAEKTEKPFFLGAGFRLPHVPCYASQKWFDLYPLEKLQLPAVLENDREDTPKFSWYLHWKLPEPRLSWLKQADQWKPLVRAYLASISFMDSQVGRLLEALEKSGQKENTLVVLWSDHGWHLGEKGISGKNSLWERSTRVPMIIAGPGIKPGVCAQPVQLLDLFPTLVEFCRLNKVQGLEGHSLVPLLKNPGVKWQWPAITTHNQGNHAIRSERYRYIHYADGSEELYDHCEDANEWFNLALKPEYRKILGEHRAWLPKVDLPPVPGSAHRVLTWDGKTAVWEGKAIDWKELED